MTEAAEAPEAAEAAEAAALDDDIDPDTELAMVMEEVTHGHMALEPGDVSFEGDLGETARLDDTLDSKDLSRSASALSDAEFNTRFVASNEKA